MGNYEILGKYAEAIDNGLEDNALDYMKELKDFFPEISVWIEVIEDYVAVGDYVTAAVALKKLEEYLNGTPF